jgi:hypothetical protein
LLAACESAEEPNLKEEEKKCQSIALEIEAAMYVLFNKDITKEYGRKFRLL